MVLRNSLLICFATIALAGCNAEAFQERMAEASQPFVVAANEASVTIAAEGNYMLGARPDSDPRTIPLAETTCQSLGKSSAVYQSSLDSREHYNRRNHLFLCID